MGRLGEFSSFCVIPPMAALLYRIHVEEDAQIEAFGSEYVSYSRVRSGLFPGSIEGSDDGLSGEVRL
jgi:protein-S-isoprenylcysteine O-methyltransferase Ste14